MFSLKFSLHFLIPLLIFLPFLPLSIAQLPPSETRILFQVQQFLEYPQVLQQWTNWTNFCYLPQSPSLVIVCSNNHITEITVIGNQTSSSSSPLSKNFSIEAFFTVLTKLSSLQVLTMVSLGLWGPLPDKINRFWSLQSLNLSSNLIFGNIPQSITTFKNLKALDLSDNFFNGSVPNLKTLQVLENLDLGNNQLGPTFPSLGNNLVTIILRNNTFRSDIAMGFINFDRLQLLDISSNKLIGPIPSFIFSLASIQYINLSKNQFSGALSTNLSCNENLTFIDISNNLLIGKLPICIRSKSSNRTVLDSWNCLSNGTSKNQHPYSFCQKEALAVKPTIGNKEGKNSSVKLGLIIGIIGGIVGIACVFGLLVLLILRRSERNKARNYKCDSFVFDKASVYGSPNIDGMHVKRTMRLVSMGIPPYHVFTLEEMEEATNNFDPSNLVGEGSQGQLYKGWLRDGATVLVKCLKVKQKHSLQILKQHMDVISKLRHRHLVSVLGHCIVTYNQDHPSSASTVFIVLEYIPNGSLRDYLTDWRKREVLKWPQRMGITMGIARGIQFLHTGIAPGIYGNDLKIENILLDDSLTAKISSYNMVLPSKVGSESPLNGQIESKSLDSPGNAEKDDIYQLGIILLQVITGKPVTSESELDQLRFELERSLAEAPSTLLRGVTDPSIRGTFAYESLRTVVQITVNCLCADSIKRPSIEDVLWHMQYSFQIQEGWTSSGNLSTKLSGQFNI